MENEEFYGVTDKDIFNFVETCLSEEDGFLHITTMALAETFALLCKKFQGASILDFAYTTENDSVRIMYKRKNDFYLHLGVHVFLPDLRFGETYANDVTFVFREVSEIYYNPISLNNNTEIEIDTFTVNSNECIFSCHAKDDKEKKFSVKAKELLVENYITSEDYEDDDFENQSIELNNPQKNQPVKPLPALELARKRFNEKSYNDCIHILKYQYKDINKDDVANNLLSLCYSYLNNPTEAIIYANKAIELNNTCPTYFANKGHFLCRVGLFKDAMYCFNHAIEISPDEEYSRHITKYIIDLVNLRTHIYSPYNLVDTNIFEEYILYFDSIINLQYCFPEFRKKFQDFKKEAVSYFFKRTKEIYNDFYITKSYQNISNRCRAILNVTDLDSDIQFETQKMLQDSNKYLQTERQERNFIEELYKKGYSVKEIRKAFNEKFHHTIYENEVRKQIEKIKPENGVLINPLPNPRDKRSAISAMMDEGYTKSEMIEQLSSDFGISEESAQATINSYYKDDDLQLGSYFDDLLDDEEDEFDEEDS